MDKSVDPLSLVHRYHDAMPLRIREYLNHRGIPDAVIDLHLLGWNGERITIPIFDRDGVLRFFRLARDPEDARPGPKVLTQPGARAELYGWERVRVKPCQIIICEGEFDRLVVEGQGFAAVTSTAGAGVFHRDWAAAIGGIPEIFICFDRDKAGERGTRRVCELLPGAKVVQLPDEVGPGGDITDFFVKLRKTREDFVHLLDVAQSRPQQPRHETTTGRSSPATRSRDENVDAIKALISIESLVARYVTLSRTGNRPSGLCPFHEDHRPSLVIYPESATFYCFGCQAHGDVITFLMKVEHLSFREALDALRGMITTQNG